MSSELYDALEKDPSEALPLIRRLCHGVMVNERFRDILSDTPLHKAARDQSSEVVELLLDKGASINALNSYGCSPLFLAVTHGQIENCKGLLERGADATLRDCDGESMLGRAAVNEHLAIVEMLLDYGVDINTREPTGETALNREVMIDHADTISVGGKAKLVRVVESFSTTKLKIMKLLISRGIDINVRLVDGATTLHTAALVGDIETVRILLDAGADPNAVDDCNRKPLWFAARNNRVNIVKSLLEMTTNINDQVYNGHTCLTSAARWGHTNCVKLLLEAGAEIWSQESGPQFLEPEKRLPWYGCDALWWAVDDLDTEDVRIVLAAGAERGERTPEGGYAGWLEVWDGAQSEELENFMEWICRRNDLSTRPEVEALRAEMLKKVHGMEQERRRKFAEQIGIRYNEEDVEKGGEDRNLEVDERETDGDSGDNDSNDSNDCEE